MNNTTVRTKPNIKGELDQDGDMIWTDSEGRWHREDGPAIIYPDGHVNWFYHGWLHREDGPAVDESYDLRWYVYGIDISKDEWLQWLKEAASSLGRNTELKLILEHS
jgi:hypothetical protein